LSLLKLEAVTYYCETPKLVSLSHLDAALGRLREQHCREGPPILAQFFLPSVEFIERLARYLVGRRHSTILEVGAGVGALADFLSIQSPLANCQVRAVDIAPALAQIVNPRSIVEEMDYRKALVKFQPDCVLCAFMEPRHDWTEDFVQARVNEYILIGFEDHPLCVCGVPASWKPRPGYERQDLESLAQYTACYLGSGVRPQVVSFQRSVMRSESSIKA